MQNGVASAKKKTPHKVHGLCLGTPKDSGHLKSCVLSHSQDWNSKLLCAEWTKLGRGMSYYLLFLISVRAHLPWARHSKEGLATAPLDVTPNSAQQQQQPLTACPGQLRHSPAPGQRSPAHFEATLSSLRNPDTHLVGFFLNSTRQQKAEK